LQLAENVVDKRVAVVGMNALVAESDHEPELATATVVRRIVDDCPWLSRCHRWPVNVGAYGRGVGRGRARD
jgi:hypothetical protein